MTIKYGCHVHPNCYSMYSYFNFCGFEATYWTVVTGWNCYVLVYCVCYNDQVFSYVSATICFTLKLFCFISKAWIAVFTKKSLMELGKFCWSLIWLEDCLCITKGYIGDQFCAQCTYIVVHELPLLSTFVSCEHFLFHRTSFSITSFRFCYRTLSPSTEGFGSKFMQLIVDASVEATRIWVFSV